MSPCSKMVFAGWPFVVVLFRFLSFHCDHSRALRFVLLKFRDFGESRGPVPFGSGETNSVANLPPSPVALLSHR